MRAQQVDIPHFTYPFGLASDGRSASVEEQDTVEEIRGCVELICRTPVGHRAELPEFGVPDLTFRQADADGVDVGDLEVAVETWEPRVDVLVDQAPALLDETARTVSVHMRGA